MCSKSDGKWTSFVLVQKWHFDIQSFYVLSVEGTWLNFCFTKILREILEYWGSAQNPFLDENLVPWSSFCVMRLISVNIVQSQCVKKHVQIKLGIFCHWFWREVQKKDGNPKKVLCLDLQMFSRVLLRSKHFFSEFLAIRK